MTVQELINELLEIRGYKRDAEVFICGNGKIEEIESTAYMDGQGEAQVVFIELFSKDAKQNRDKRPV